MRYCARATGLKSSAPSWPIPSLRAAPGPTSGGARKSPSVRRMVELYKIVTNSVHSRLCLSRSRAVTPQRSRLPALLLSFFCLAPLAARAVDPPPAPDKPEFSLRRSVTDTAEKVWDGAQSVAVYALGTIGVNYKFGGNTPQ